MNSTTEKVIEDVIEAEGGYANDPNDRGGETMYGVTVAVARAAGYVGAMRELPRSLAQTIYRQRYIQTPQFDAVLRISPQIGSEMIDTGVNMGPHRAAEFLQRWLNGFNSPGSRYSDLFVDGRVGALTLDALERFLDKRGREGENVMLRALNGIQGGYYLERTEKDRSQRDFLYGWVRTRVVM